MLQTVHLAAWRSWGNPTKNGRRCLLPRQKQPVAKIKSNAGSSSSLTNQKKTGFNLKVSKMSAYIGQRRSYNGALCTVRYSGEVAGTSGIWLGVEWDDPSRGKHDGQHRGIRYFTCGFFSSFFYSYSEKTMNLTRRARQIQVAHFSILCSPNAICRCAAHLRLSATAQVRVGCCR